eukprot:1142424-Pelagomonas_calceolata.AAC.5
MKIKRKSANGDLEGYWKHLAVRIIIVYNSTPSGNQFVGICNRMGMKFASKYNGRLVVKSQLFQLKGLLSVTGLANTQEDGM